MSIKWCGLKETKVSALKLSGKFKARFDHDHVLALAKSIVAVGVINTPAVCWRLGKLVVREVAAGEDRIAASVLVACWKLAVKEAAAKEGLTSELGVWERAVERARAGQGMDTLIFVRVFNCDTEQEIREVRAYENAHRRHDDRDKWLADLARAPGEDSGADDGPIDFHEAPPLDPPDNVAQGVATLCICGHAQEQHGDFGAPNCTECTCEVYEVEGEQVPAGFSDMEPCASPDCGHAALDHEAGACEARKCKCKAFVLGKGVPQQGGVPSVPLAPAAGTAGASKQPVTKAEKSAAYKAAAETATQVTGKTVTPAAVKQAAHRVRKAAGEATSRTKHDDSGEPIGALGLQVKQLLINVDRDLKGAITALTNGLKKHPELGDRTGFNVHGVLEELKEQAKVLRGYQPEAPCVFCLGQGPQASCQACQGQRWLTKRELDEAPAELRKAAGL